MNPRLLLIPVALLILAGALYAGLGMGRSADAPRSVTVGDGATTASKPAGTVPASTPAGSASAYAFCAACHRPDGRGMTGIFPGLAGSARMTGDPRQAVAIVLGGFDSHAEANAPRWSTRMQPLAHLSDQMIADAVSFARSSWGNQAPPITAALVAEVRARHGQRRTPWTPADLAQASAP